MSLTILKDGAKVADGQTIDFLDSGTAVFTITDAGDKITVALETGGSQAEGSSINDSNGNELVEFGVTASAVNHIKITNAATGNVPVISVESEADLGLEFHNDQGEQILILTSAATSVNEITITSAATGVAPSVAATGGDTTIDLQLNAKGDARVVTNAALLQEHGTTAAINSTATATAAQVGTGYITSTSGAGTTITLPTGTDLGTELGAVQGTIHELYIDNTAGSNTVTIAVSTNGILSDLGDTAPASQLTVANGVTGQARFTLMFSSATAFTFTRTA